jgi:hypothetical protein
MNKNNFTTMNDDRAGWARAAIPRRQRQNQVLVAAALLALGLYGCGFLTLIF